jgi:hypothetical protein
VNGWLGRGMPMTTHSLFTTTPTQGVWFLFEGLFFSKLGRAFCVRAYFRKVGEAYWTSFFNSIFERDKYRI